MKKINLKNVRIEVRLIFVKLLITTCLLKEIPSRGLKLESDHLTFEDCSIGEIARAGVYTDVDNLILINNHFDSIKTHAFSGNINVFNFTGNTVNMLEDEAFQLSALNIEFSNNNIESIKIKVNVWIKHKSLCTKTGPLNCISYHLTRGSK